MAAGQAEDVSASDLFVGVIWLAVFRNDLVHSSQIVMVLQPLTSHLCPVSIS